MLPAEKHRFAEAAMRGDKAALEALGLKAHPDQGGSAEKFRKIQGAYELLKKVHNK